MSLSNTKEAAKPDLSKMLASNTTSSVPYNTGSDLSGTTTQKDSLSPTTSSEKTLNVVSDIDSVNSYSGSASNEYNILYYPEALLASGVLGDRYPHAFGIFFNINSKSKLGKYQDAGGFVANKRLDGTILNLADNTAGQGIGTNTGGMNSLLSDLGVTAKFKRFTGCVLLPMPLNVSTQYTASYNTGGASGVVGTILKNGLNGGNASQSLGGLLSEAATAFGRDFTKNLATSAAKNIPYESIGGIENPGGLFDKVVGTVRNPRTEQVFEK